MYYIKKSDKTLARYFVAKETKDAIITKEGKVLPKSKLLSPDPILDIQYKLQLKSHTGLTRQCRGLDIDQLEAVHWMIKNPPPQPELTLQQQAKVLYMEDKDYSENYVPHLSEIRADALDEMDFPLEEFAYY